jgi:predicted metalloprotease
MKWEGREQSKNVEDRRGMGPAAAAGGGGILVIIIALIYIFLGGDPRDAQKLMEQAGGPQVQTQQQGAGVDDKYREFIGVVLRDTETIWTKMFRENVQGGEYVPPKLNIFSGQTQSGCGVATAAVGPFYCPADEQVYIDPTFFDQLARRHHAEGDFAQAYVIAHEVAHHVQHLLGFDAEVRQIEGDSNRASVRLELQADYLAGVWAHHAHKEYDILEEGDIAEGINAANQIGDDTLMKEAGVRYVDQKRFTHGSSEQRVRWFTKGLKTGDFEGCRELFLRDYTQLAP